MEPPVGQPDRGPAKVMGGSFYRTLLRTQPQKVEIEIEACLRRIDAVPHAERHRPALASRQNLGGSANADPTGVPHTVGRIEKKQDIVSGVVEQVAA